VKQKILISTSCIFKEGITYRSFFSKTALTQYWVTTKITCNKTTRSR
jgi:hypothetical protein